MMALTSLAVRLRALFLCMQLFALPISISGLSGIPSTLGDSAANSSAVVAADGVAADLAAATLPSSIGAESDSATIGADGAAELAHSSPVVPSDLYTIPLQKQYVPIKKGDKTIAFKTAYFGTFYMGSPTPQEFTAVFDTGSGHLIVPSDTCASEACLTHRRFSRALSNSSVDIESTGNPIEAGTTDRDQVAIAFGTGEILGEFVQEKVCLGVSEAKEPQHCTDLRVVVATEMTKDPFGLFAFDGVMGLGLDNLALNPAFSFFGSMASQMPNIKPQFSVFLARDDNGENAISFGGYDMAKASSPMEWAPVAMQELGYWQVQIKSVRIGDHELEECADGSCRAILDTGTSLLSVPRQSARTMHRLLARQVPEELYNDVPSIDCRTIPGQLIHFDLGGPIVTLNAEDYSRPTPFNMTLANSTEARLFCRSLLLPMDMKPPLGPKVFIWGEPVLRRYYTVYDVAKKQVGFSEAKQAAAGEGPRGLPAVGAPEAGSKVSGAPMTRPVSAGASGSSSDVTVASV